MSTVMAFIIASVTYENRKLLGDIMAYPPSWLCHRVWHSPLLIYFSLFFLSVCCLHPEDKGFALPTTVYPGLDR